MRKYLIVLLFLIFQVSYANQFRLATDTNNVLIGDIITITISSEDSTYNNWPILGELSEELILTEQTEVDTLKKENRISFEQKIKVTSFDSGSFSFPDFTYYEDEDTFALSGIILNFDYPEVDTSSAIKDIKDVLDVPTDFTKYILISLIVIILILLLYWAYKKYFKNRKKVEEDYDYDSSIPPYILAIESLKSLENEKLWQDGEYKEYYTKLTDILRIYFHRIYDVKTMELTSFELKESLKGLLDEALIKDLSYILENSDLSKFAKANPLPENNINSIEFAKKIVETTKDLSDKKEEESDD